MTQLIMLLKYIDKTLLTQYLNTIIALHLQDIQR